jgi:hypothetical protein
VKGDGLSGDSLRTRGDGGAGGRGGKFEIRRGRLRESTLGQLVGFESNRKRRFNHQNRTPKQGLGQALASKS